MKIGFIVDDTLDKPDGVQQYVLALGGWLQSRGHEVHYLCGQTHRTDIPNVHSLARNVGVRFNGNRLTIPLPASKNAIAALLNQERFDVLHVQMPHSPFLAQRVIMAASPKTAIIGTFHILPNGFWAKHLSPLLARWLKPSLNRLDESLAVSDAAGEFARQFYGIQTTTVPNTINLAPFLLAAKKRRRTSDTNPTIVYLNRLEPRKGARYLIEAVALLRTIYDQTFHVIICGKGSQSEALQQLVQKLSLDDIVTFTGFVPEDDKPRILADADIAVYPSVGGESFGIVLLEGMAACKGVVLAGDNPGYRSVMGRYGDQMVSPRDIGSFAETLKRYLDDPAERTRRASQQQRYAATFDLPVVGAHVESIYRKAAKRRTRNSQLRAK